jgi:hypothetical protein
MQLRQDSLAWHVVGDDVVVFDLDGSVYLKLNGSARFLWELLTEPRTADELASSLVGRYGIADDCATEDVAAFVDQLRQRGLLAS